jgi:uncharacterized membrane protein YtjA (UPF0391 family)
LLHGIRPQEIFMLNYAVIFFLIALVASFMGFGGVAGMSAQFGWFFAIVAIVLLVFGAIRGRGGLLRP